MLLGQLGRNWVVAHRKNVIRCAPEQLRHASSEERAIASDAPTNELLGIKNLLEHGQFPKSQFEDLVPCDTPPHPEDVQQNIQSSLNRVAMTAGELARAQKEPQPAPALPESSARPASADVELPATVRTPDTPSTEVVADKSQSSYGPVRVRHWNKSPQNPLVRPDGSQYEDFGEMMQELVPSMLSTGDVDMKSDNNMGASSPRSAGHKRGASKDAQEHEGSRMRTESPREACLTCEEV